MNSVMKVLESGKASVKGMKMLYPVTSASLFRVTVKGISFGGDSCRCSNGPSIVIAPIDGVGDMTVEVSKLVDDNAQSRDAYFRQHKAEAFRRDKHIDSLGAVGLRRIGNEIVAALPAAARKTLQDTSNFELSAEGTIPAKMNQYELKRVVLACIKVKFKVTELDDN